MKKNYFLGLLLSLIIITFSNYSKLYSEDWENLGHLYSNAVICIYGADNGNVYIGGGGRLIYSNDDGNSWEYINDAGLNPGIHSIYKVNEDNQGRIYVACSNGLFMSEDGISNWTHLIQNQQITNIQFDDNGAAYVVAGSYQSGYNLFFNTGTNNEWTEITPEDQQIDYITLTIHSSELMILGTGNNTLYSNDKGISWNEILEDGESIKLHNVYYLEDNFIAIKRTTNGFAGIYQSVDGINWSKLNHQPETLILDFMMYNKHTNTVFGSNSEAGIILSKDNGDNWKIEARGLGADPYFFNTIGFAKNGDAYLAAQDSRVFRYKNPDTGVLENELEELLLYPNPSEDFIYIDVKQGSNLKISDINGNYFDVIAEGSQIDIRALSAGVYYIIIEENDEIKYKKFIKR